MITSSLQSLINRSISGMYEFRTYHLNKFKCFNIQSTLYVMQCHEYNYTKRKLQLLQLIFFINCRIINNAHYCIYFSKPVSRVKVLQTPSFFLITWDMQDGAVRSSRGEGVI